MLQPPANKQDNFKPDIGEVHNIKIRSINSSGFRLALAFAVVVVVAITFVTGYYLLKSDDSTDIQTLNFQNLRNNSGDVLVYEADLRNTDPLRKEKAMEGLKEVIEGRLEAFGISNPNVRIRGDNRLIVDLTGVKDKTQVARIIEEAPLLEFREEASKEEFFRSYKQQTGQDLPADAQGPFFVPTGLTGKDLATSKVDFDPSSGRLIVKLQFNDEGRKLFADLTTKNVGKPIAIYLDGAPITAPRVDEPITDGNAVISGNFTFDEANILVVRLNAGALPVPIKLISK